MRGLALAAIAAGLLVAGYLEFVGSLPTCRPGERIAFSSFASRCEVSR